MKSRYAAAALSTLIFFSTAHGQQFGAFTSFQPNEITPGLYVRLSGERVAYQWNMSIPVLLHDQYNGNRTNVSFWSSYMVALGVMEYFAGVEITADSLSSLPAQLLFLALPILSNGELHFNIIPKSAVDAGNVGASAFIGWDTALFEIRDIQWFRLAPKAGLACCRIFGAPDGNKKRLSLGLKIGVKMNVDSPADGKSPVVGFFSLEAGMY